MILNEPPHSAYDLNFRLAGIPVRIHPLFWLVSLVMGAVGGWDAVGIVAWMLAVFVGIMVHELGHALAARSFGLYSRIVLYGMGGVTPYDGREIAWWRRLLILAAGPGAGFLLAALILTVVWNSVEFGGASIVRFGDTSRPFLEALVFYSLFINIAWGILNLFPVFPLDGGQITRTVLCQFWPFRGLRWSLRVSVVVAVGVAILSLLNGVLFAGILFAILGYGSFQELQRSSILPGGGNRW